MSAPHSQHHTLESSTLEFASRPRFTIRLFTLSKIAQGVSSLAIVILAFLATLFCSYFRFSGITLILALIIVGLQTSTCILIKRDSLLGSFASGALCFAFCLLAFANECTCLVCTQSKFKNSDFCKQFRSTTDICQWIMSNSTRNFNENFESKFGGGRAAIFVLSFVTLMSCSIILIILLFSVRIGKPVFLLRRRHKRSIVVGRITNVALALKNKNANVKRLTQPQHDELLDYDEKRLGILREFLGYTEDQENSVALFTAFENEEEENSDLMITAEIEHEMEAMNVCQKSAEPF